MSGDKIRVGIIGASPSSGWARDTHVPAIRANPQYELVAICTSREETAQAAKAQWGVEFAFDNVDALLALDQLDLVVVSVRVPKHFELVSAVIAAGKDILCEWPLGNGLAEAEKLAAMAEAKGVGNWVCLQQRSSPAINFIRDLVAGGYVGEVLSTSIVGSAIFWGEQIDADHAFLFDRANGATPLSIPCAHRVDAMCYCLGQFKEVSATLTNRIKSATVIETGETIIKNVDDEIAFSGLLESGALASVHYRGGFTRATNLLWEINGTKGDLQMTDFQGHGHDPAQAVLGARGDELILAPLEIPERYFAIPALPAANEALEYNIAQHYRRLAEDMNNGSRQVPMFAQALELHRLLDAVENASTTGHRQRVS